MSTTAHVCINLSNRPENIPTIRQALAGFADGIGLPPVDVNDISTALSEACNNASLHAYDGAEGPLQVELRAFEEAIGVAVRDCGRGLSGVALEGRRQAHGAMAGIDGELGGIGLPAIHGLASRVELNEYNGGGTEVLMVFELGQHHPTGRRQVAFSQPGDELARLPLDSTIMLDMAPLEIAGRVLPRVLRAMAARAGFGVDRLPVLQALGEQLLRHAPPVLDGPQRVCIAIQGGLEVGIGPLGSADARALAVAMGRVEPALEAVSRWKPGTDQASQERLVLRIPRRP